MKKFTEVYKLRQFSGKLLRQMNCSCGHLKMQGTLEEIKSVVCQGISTADFHITTRRDALTCPIPLRALCLGKFSFLSLEFLPNHCRWKILCELKSMVRTLWYCSTDMSLMTGNSRASYWDVSLILDVFISLHCHLPFVFPFSFHILCSCDGPVYTAYAVHTGIVCFKTWL